MDPLAHATISALIVAKKKKWSAALVPWVVYGILPDIYIFFALLGRFLGSNREVLDDFFYTQYNVTHSLVFFLVMWLIICGIKRRIYWPFVMYGLHIVTDIISHQGVQTPFLWPVSDFTVPGLFSYTEPTAFLITYAIMVPIWVYIAFSSILKYAKG